MPRPRGMSLIPARHQLLDERIEIFSRDGKSVMRKLGVRTRPASFLFRQAEDRPSDTDLGEFRIAVQNHFAAENVGVETFRLLQIPDRNARMIEGTQLGPTSIRHALSPFTISIVK